MIEKVHVTPLSLLFPWLAPLVISCKLVPGGVEVQLHQNGRLLHNWQPARLRHVLPEPLITWMEDHSIHQCPQPYPLVRKFLDYLAPYTSKKLIIDFSQLAYLQTGKPPRNFALVWRLNRELERLEGLFEGADHYLGMGWFHAGDALWSLDPLPSPVADAQLSNLVVPLEQASHLLNTLIPQLKQYIPICADFQLISDCSFHITAPFVKGDKLTLALTCSYPELLRTLSLPQQKIDLLLARQAIIEFPRQALTPVFTQLLQNKRSLALRGTDIPLFIKEQLPILRHYRVISDEQAAFITRACPIVSLAMVQPTRSYIHAYEQGIGTYSMVATYRYQEQVLDPDALLAAHRRGQRFVQQGDIWFEWPENPPAAFLRTLQQSRLRSLRPEEVMGFDTQHMAAVGQSFPTHALQPDGTTPAKRARSLFQQLREHGIPGGILGESPGLVKLFVETCESLLHDNRQARILWLVPPQKRGAVTRAVNASAISGSVTVASLASLQDEPDLMTRSWTLVLFQELDKLSDQSVQFRRLSQFQWKWALLSLTSAHAIQSQLMPILHVSQEYYEQFCTRFLFDLSQSQPSPATSTSIPGSVMAQSTASDLENDGIDPAPSYKESPIELSHHKIAKLHEESAFLQERLAVEDEELPIEPDPLQRQLVAVQLAQLAPAPAIPRSLSIASSPGQPGSHMDTVAKKEEGTAQVPADKDRSAEKAARGKQATDSASPFKQRFAAATYQLAAKLNLDVAPKHQVEAAHVYPRQVDRAETNEPDHKATVDAAMKKISAHPAPELDEDWQVILQHWKPEHWEIILSLYRGETDQLPIVARKAQRPLSQLIDEINSPVAEQLEDWFIEPETHTLTTHFLVTAGNLVQWHMLHRQGGTQ